MMKENEYLKMINKLKNREHHIQGHKQMRKSAVFVPFVEEKKGLSVAFEVRSHLLRRQPGEICFPGGRIDEDDPSPQSAAVRETCEELGVTTNQVEVVAPLDVLVTPFQSIIYPFVGFIRNFESLKPNPKEVAEVFTVPLSFFQTHKPKKYAINVTIQPEEQFPFHLIHGGENYKWSAGRYPEYFYEYEGQIIWGLTARILTNLLEDMNVYEEDFLI